MAAAEQGEHPVAMVGQIGMKPHPAPRRRWSLAPRRRPQTMRAARARTRGVRLRPRLHPDGRPRAAARRERSLHLVRSFNRTIGEQGRPTDEVVWLKHRGSEMHAEMLPTCDAVANRIYARAGVLPCGPGDLVGS